MLRSRGHQAMTGQLAPGASWARSVSSASVVTAGRDSDAAIGDHWAQLMGQPPSSCCAAARASRLRANSASVNQPRPTSVGRDRKSTRLNSSHTVISYAVFCLKKKKKNNKLMIFKKKKKKKKNKNK